MSEKQQDDIELRGGRERPGGGWGQTAPLKGIRVGLTNNTCMGQGCEQSQLIKCVSSDENKEESDAQHTAKRLVIDSCKFNK